MNINVNIERLVLEGVSVPPNQRPLLQAAVEAELARLLMAEGLGSGLRSGSVVPRVPAGTIKLSSEGNPAQLGQQIAQAVYGGMGA